MPDITMQFSRQEYPSLQIGDLAYYAIMKESTLGGFSVNEVVNNNPEDPEDYVLIGDVTAITEAFLEDGVTPTTSITIDASNSVEPPTTANFIFFKKKGIQVDPNISSLLGYFGSANFINKSSKKAELYATSCEISESSK